MRDSTPAVLVWRSCKHLFAEKTMAVSIPFIYFDLHLWPYQPSENIVISLLKIEDCSSTITNVQVYEEYQDSSTTMAKQQHWLLEEESILTVKTQLKYYRCIFIAQNTQHQRLWNNNLPYEGSSKGKSSTNLTEFLILISDLVNHRRTSNLLETRTNYAVLMTKSSVDDAL